MKQYAHVIAPAILPMTPVSYSRYATHRTTGKGRRILLDSGDMAMDQADRIAEAFVAARRAGTSMADYPGAKPTDLAHAYAIQERAIALDGRMIAGWKVGRVHMPTSEILGTDRLAGPIFGDSIALAAVDDAVDMPIFAGGFAAVEAELLFRIDIMPANGARDLSDSALMAHVGAVHVGIEIASSPYPHINADGPLVTASDFGNNAGLIVGPELADWSMGDLAAVEASVAIDGIEQGRADMRALPGGPVESVRFLLGHVAARSTPTALPFWVSAGAISGVHPIAIGSIAVATFKNTHVIQCRMIAAGEQ